MPRERTRDGRWRFLPDGIVSSVDGSEDGLMRRTMEASRSGVWRRWSAPVWLGHARMGSGWRAVADAGAVESTRVPTIVVALMVVLFRSFAADAQPAGQEPLPSSPAAGAVFRDCPACPELVAVPAGAWRVGRPPLDVRVGTFALGRYEVTRGEYATFVAATGHSADGGCHVLDGGQWRYDPRASWREPGFAQDDSHPVVCVGWADAWAYVDWLSDETGHAYRLPAEVEWEYVGRTAGPRGAECMPGNGYDDGLCADGVARTAPAGSFAANRFGLFDLLGNVMEWAGAFCRASDEYGWRDDCDYGTYHGRRYGGSWDDRLWPPLADLLAGFAGHVGERRADTGFRVARRLPVAGPAGPAFGRPGAPVAVSAPGDVEVAVATLFQDMAWALDVTIAGPFFEVGGTEPLTIRATSVVPEWALGKTGPAEVWRLVRAGEWDPWRYLRKVRAFGGVEFYRGARLLGRVGDTFISRLALSRTPRTGRLNVHVVLDSSGGPNPWLDAVVARYDAATGGLDTHVFMGTYEDRQEERLFGCARDERPWPSLPPRVLSTATFRPCEYLGDPLERRERAARDLKVLAAGRRGVRTAGLAPPLLCRTCAVVAAEELSELLAASGVTVERAASPDFDVASVFHEGFGLEDSFAAVFVRPRSGRGWTPLYAHGPTRRALAGGVAVELAGDGHLVMSGVACSAEMDGYECKVIVNLHDMTTRLIESSDSLSLLSSDIPETHQGRILKDRVVVNGRLLDHDPANEYAEAERITCAAWVADTGCSVATVAPGRGSRFTEGEGK